MNESERAQFLEERKCGIGSSDVSSILGINTWKSPLQLYLEKIGEGEPVEDNPSMEWGRRLESLILDTYAEKTGEIMVPGRHFYRDEYRIAHLDGLTQSNRIVEAKTARTAQGWGEEGTDEIPVYYAAQVHHQMLVCNFEVVDVPVLIAGSDFRIYTLRRERSIDQILLEKEAEFWDHVKARIPPEPVSLNDVSLLYPKSIQSAIECDQTTRNLISILIAARQNREIQQTVIDDMELRIKKLLGPYEAIVQDGKPLITWKQAKDIESTDWKAVAATLGATQELIKNFTTVKSGSRRFLVK